MMGEILTRHGSDKDMPGHHGYGPVYDELLWNRRFSVRNVLEIGIAEGQSVLAWLEIFPNATVVGMDIEPYHGPCPPRLEIHQGDQRDEFALLRAVNGRQFDLIVEDAQHTLDNSLRTLFFLYPYIRSPRGLYVIEELEGVNGHLDNIGMLRGGRVIRTEGPTSAEYLVVIET